MSDGMFHFKTYRLGVLNETERLRQVLMEDYKTDYGLKVTVEPAAVIWFEWKFPHGEVHRNKVFAYEFGVHRNPEQTIREMAGWMINQVRYVMDKDRPWNLSRQKFVLSQKELTQYTQAEFLPSIRYEPERIDYILHPRLSRWVKTLIEVRRKDGVQGQEFVETLKKDFGLSEEDIQNAVKNLSKREG